MRSVVENERAGLGDDGRRADVLDGADADRLDGDGGGGVAGQEDRAENEGDDGESALHWSLPWSIPREEYGRSIPILRTNHNSTK